MKKITLLLGLLIASVSSYAIEDGTYTLTGAPFAATITFDNDAEEFTINITGAVTTGYVSIGFSNSADGAMNGKYALYMANSKGSFALSEHLLLDYGLGTTLAPQATINSQDLSAGDISITRAYAAANGGFSFSSTDTELYFVSAKGASAASYHGSDRYKGSVSIGIPTGVKSLPELVGLQLNNNFSQHTLELTLPATAKGIYDVEVFNSNGQTVMTKQINSNTLFHSFNELSGSPAGTYFVRLNQNGKFTTLKASKN